MLFMKSYYKLSLYRIISILSIIPQTYRYLRFGLPPEYKKRAFLKNIIRNIDFDNAIETGTYLGQTAKLLRQYIPNVHSIEIKKELYLFAKKKYRLTNINFIHGDSADSLAILLKNLVGPTFFFLDGHASGGITARGQLVTSLSQEINILSSFKNINNSLILVDDALSLNGTNDYPDLEDILIFAKERDMTVFKTRMNSLVIIGRLLKSNFEILEPNLEKINIY